MDVGRSVPLPSRLILPLAVCISLSSCRDPLPVSRSFPPLDPSAFSGEQAYDEARQLVKLGPRDAGTPGAEQATRHIRDRLIAAGVEAEITIFEEETSYGLTTFRNIIGRIPGGDAGIVIIGSHFDTKSGIAEDFEGANDSASSTGALIELARILRDQAGPDGHPVEFRFLFFDGEECRIRYGPRDGFHGSRHYANELVQRGEADLVRAVIVLDMIGDKDLTLTLPRNSDPELLAAVLDAAREEGMRSSVALSPHAIGDDHVPFLEAGMPAVDIIDFEFGSRPGLNDYWHTPEDTMDKISAESLGAVGRLTVRTLNRVLSGKLPAP